MKMIKQGVREKTCAGCVAAMITGETLDDVYEFMGSFHTPFQTAKIFAYLLSRGIIPGYCVNKIIPQRDNENFLIGYQLELSTSQPAYVVVDLPGYSAPHAIFWDGARVWDPQFSEPGATLQNYKIVSWTPLYIPVESCRGGWEETNEGYSIEGGSTVNFRSHPRRVHPGPPCPITLIQPEAV